jgi:hypothetical protein
MNTTQRKQIAEHIVSFNTFVIESDDANTFNFEIDNKFYIRISLDDALLRKDIFFEVDESSDSDKLVLSAVDAEILQQRLERIEVILETI